MVLPAQFQLGLELTNLVNPMSQAMSALGSLAVMDAIKKSGSDFITETKLANLIGRHRIDPVIGIHFRGIVAKSDQSVLSRYLDIILESGSGPTVQEALKNPALFSMVIQLSGLAFAHGIESLANAMVEAIEGIVNESHGNMSIVPDYVSLLGTIQACQQQTAAFRWAWLYEAAEDKMSKILASPDGDSSKRLPSGKFVIHEKPEQARGLPVPVVQGLLMWLQSLQSLPEHRLLHVRCDTGLSTVVVWCHHILGLSVMIQVGEMDVRFGNAPYNLVVELSSGQKAGVSLMDPLEPQEPLFTLQGIKCDTAISYERRAEAYGYGTKLCQFHGMSEKEQGVLARLVISQSVEKYQNARQDQILSGYHYPSETRLLAAGRFLFALDESITFPRPTSSNSHPLADILEDIVITFARIPEDDLARCKEMPLTLIMLSSSWTRTQLRSSFRFRADRNLLDSFKILSKLLVGHHVDDDYVKPAVLLSAWGWSFFLDSMDAIDPLDVSVDTLRVVRGVPSRRGFHRTRIIDGPRKACPSVTARKCLVAGVSTAEKGAILVGHHSDAFQVTQQFTCHNELLRYGFREMAEWSICSERLRPCDPHSCKSKQPTETKLEAIDKILGRPSEYGARQPLTSSSEEEPNFPPGRVFEGFVHRHVFIDVSGNPAARWLQLGAVCYLADTIVVLAGPDTCLTCTIRKAGVHQLTKCSSSRRKSIYVLL